MGSSELGAAPHLCPASGRPSASGGEPTKPDPYQAVGGGRKERKRKGAGRSEEERSRLNKRKPKPGWPWPRTGSAGQPGSVSGVSTEVSPLGSSGRNRETRRGPPSRASGPRTYADLGRLYRRAPFLSPGLRCALVGRPRDHPVRARCARERQALRAPRPRPPRPRKEEGRQRLVSTVYTLFQTTGF